MSSFVIGFLIGGAPFWRYNLEHGFASFKMFTAASGGDSWEHFAGMVLESVPILLGAKQFWSEEDLYPGATVIVLVALAVFLISVVFMRAGPLLRLFKLQVDTKKPVEIFLLVAGCCVVIFSLSSFGYLYRAPRYLLPIYIPFFVVLGWWLARLHHIAPLACNIIIPLVLAHNLYSNFPKFHAAVPGEPHVFDGQRVSKDHSELLEWLEQRGISAVRTNYWIGYRLAFESDGRIKFRTFFEPRQERIEEYQRAIPEQQLDQTPLILVPAQAPLVELALRKRGKSFQTAEASGYKIIYAITDQIHNAASSCLDLTVTASDSSESATAALDGDLATRWGSGRPQSQGMEFQINFSSPTILAEMAIRLGDFRTDYPRELEIQVIDSSGAARVVCDLECYRALRYLSDGSENIHLADFGAAPIKAVRLIQTGSDPVFDWSIAELELRCLSQETGKPGVVR
jgi:hypothetical protein